MSGNWRFSSGEPWDVYAGVRSADSNTLAGCCVDGLEGAEWMGDQHRVGAVAMGRGLKAAPWGGLWLLLAPQLLLYPSRVCPDDVPLRPREAPPGLPSSQWRGEEEPELASPAVAAESPGCIGGWGLPAPRGGAHPGPPPLRTVKDSLLQLESGGARRRGGHRAKPAEVMPGAKGHVPSCCWLGGPGSPPADPTQHVRPRAKPPTFALRPSQLASALLSQNQ